MTSPTNSSASDGHAAALSVKGRRGIGSGKRPELRPRSAPAVREKCTRAPGTIPDTIGHGYDMTTLDCVPAFSRTYPPIMSTDITDPKPRGVNCLTPFLRAAEARHDCEALARGEIPAHILPSDSDAIEELRNFLELLPHIMATKPQPGQTYLDAWFDTRQAFAADFGHVLR
jgi:hypothetical protein